MHGFRSFAALVLIVALAGWPSCSLAAGDWMQGKALKQLVTGKHVYLKVPFGGEFPLYYKPNGQVSGDGTSVGLGRFLKPKETGRWWVKGQNLCQKWPTWYKGRTTCFTIEKTGPRTIKWLRDDGKSGTARIEN